MSEQANQELEALFAAYAPVLGDEPFVGRAAYAIARQQRLMRCQSAAVFSVIVLMGVSIAFMFSSLIDNWFSLVHVDWVRWTGAMSPVAAQLSTYGIAALVAIFGRRRIRAFIAPW